MLYVVGSGPAGVACAQALVDAGRDVTILDGGSALETDRNAVRENVAGKRRQDWASDEIAVLRTVVPKNGKVPLKLAHGSDYSYRRPVAETPDISYGHLNIRASYAVGGLSNVWGASILPFRASDMAGWPVSHEDLLQSYREIYKLIPVAAREDDLCELFPMPGASFEPLRQSRQIETLMRHAAAKRQTLNDAGIYVGGSRLAVDTAGKSSVGNCYYCGYCLHGCPRDLVYSTRHSLAGLLRSGRVTYRPGTIVRAVSEKEGGVRLDAFMADGTPLTLEGERVFLAAGTLSSTAILLRSLGLYDHEVRFKDSQYYLFPLLQRTAARQVDGEALHTLCQSFIEIFDQDISPYTVHLQVYSYNDHLAQILDHKLGPLRHVFPSNVVLGRMLLVQGYLHSDHSGGIRAWLRRRDGRDVLELQEVLNPQTEMKVAQVMGKLARHARHLDAVPVPPLLEVTEPGRGFHTGGSFPMAAQPEDGQTDRLGRPHGMHRTHVVDATVFPTIPATTITLSAMANAHRIGKETASI